MKFTDNGKRIFEEDRDGKKRPLCLSQVRSRLNVQCATIRKLREQLAELEGREQVDVELVGDGSTIISDVLYLHDKGAGVVFSRGETKPVATTNELEGVFMRVLSQNPESLEVLGNACLRAAAKLRAALREGE